MPENPGIARKTRREANNPWQCQPPVAGTRRAPIIPGSPFSEKRVRGVRYYKYYFFIRSKRRNFRLAGACFRTCYAEGEGALHSVDRDGWGEPHDWRRS